MPEAFIVCWLVAIKC